MNNNKMMMKNDYKMSHEELHYSCNDDDRYYNNCCY